MSIEKQEISLEYFHPKVEDLHIGYECEVNWSKGYSEEFEPFTIELTDSHTGIYKNSLKDLTIGIDDGYMEVRVPYLNKDQIEAEGWLHTGGQMISRGRQGFEKNNRFLVLDLRGPLPRIEMIYKDPSKEEGTWYSPESFSLKMECPTINEFRYICKLLQI